VQIPELNAEIRVKILRRQECPEFWRQKFRDKESGKKKPVKVKSLNQESVDEKAVCRLSHDKIKAAAETGGQRLVFRTRRQALHGLCIMAEKKLMIFVDEKRPPREEAVFASLPATEVVAACRQGQSVRSSSGRQHRCSFV
jgi:hypothetical protein